jgi:hypothetical protein
MRTRWALVLIWGCFVARLAFYSAMQPLWEGYDEWAHFAVIRTMLAKGEALVSRDAPIPRDVEASFELAPVPYEMRRPRARRKPGGDCRPGSARGAKRSFAPCRSSGAARPAWAR